MRTVLVFRAVTDMDIVEKRGSLLKSIVFPPPTTRVHHSFRNWRHRHCFVAPGENGCEAEQHVPIAGRRLYRSQFSINIFFRELLNSVYLRTASFGVLESPCSIKAEIPPVPPRSILSTMCGRLLRHIGANRLSRLSITIAANNLQPRMLNVVPSPHHRGHIITTNQANFKT